MLTFDQVRFYYKKGQPVVENLDLTIEQGEFVAIVGANGCGKSTIAKLMDGLLLPKEGSVKYNGLHTSKQSDLNMIHQQIGIVFQNPEDQFITTTVMDEIIFGLENIRVPREDIHSRLDDALRAVQMEDYREMMPHQLSGGQKQRVAIAAILAMRPNVIIFDEATSMLDTQGRDQIMSIMHELHRQGMTVIVVTHHMEEVLYAERVLLIHQGRLEFDGEPSKLFLEIDIEKYQLELPFAVRVHNTFHLISPVRADWKEMIRLQWSIN
ncbi:energy-coupling factor transporter ATPase [Paenibacillus endoradicis]|uniref:energy-coupling factor transporter ATPase n=1 Tax=Paenibacillus endoradicis TaxID=2972487 RepID=UPI00215973E9|nr:energy-coupling factor transporter ATPase [Paenibacillus endoradicis]MCR8656467.1 energy-coupling factor transporter ATPase [Paenibacillus endoradicis]